MFYLVFLLILFNLFCYIYVLNSLLYFYHYYYLVYYISYYALFNLLFLLLFSILLYVTIFLLLLYVMIEINNREDKVNWSEIPQTKTETHDSFPLKS